MPKTFCTISTFVAFLGILSFVCAESEGNDGVLDSLEHVGLGLTEEETMNGSEKVIESLETEVQQTNSEQATESKDYPPTSTDYGQFEIGTDAQSAKIQMLEQEEPENADLRIVNETLSHEQNMTENESLNKSVNASIRWNCSKFSLDSKTSVFVVKNESQLLELISKSNSTNSCFLLYFYLQWCKFCAEMSVFINTVSRVYDGFPVLAIDAYALTSITGRFGITGVPSLLPFYHGRPIAKFNGTRSLEHLSNFIVNYTGLPAINNITTVDEDYDGPLVTKIDQKSDIYLALSLLCLSIIFAVNLCRTDVVQQYLKSSILKFKSWALKQKED